MNKEHGQVTGIIWRGHDRILNVQKLKGSSLNDKSKK